MPGQGRRTILLRSLISGRRIRLWDNDRLIASYILNTAKGKVLVDDSQGTYIVFFSESPERFVVQGIRFLNLFKRAVSQCKLYTDQ